MYVWTFPSSAASLHVDLANPVVSRYAVFCCTSVSLDILSLSPFPEAQILSSNKITKAISGVITTLFFFLVFFFLIIYFF